MGETSGAQEEVLGLQYDSSVKVPTRDYYEQPYHVTITVRSPKFSGTAQGYSSISLENAHGNAWHKLRNPAANLVEQK